MLLRLMLNTDYPTTLESSSKQTLTRPKILILADWFAPGYKAGGPIQSCVNFAYLMRDSYDIYVFTSDRDLHENQPYPTIKTDSWITFDNHIFVYYFSPTNKTIATLKNQIAKVSPQYLYLNSLIAPYFAVLPLFLNYIKPLPLKIVVAPRGMLRSSALQYKSFKKKAFLTLARWMGLIKNLSFHATDTAEQQDIKRFFPEADNIAVVNNPPRIKAPEFRTIEKKEHDLKLLFIGRIHPIKNLTFLLDVLPSLPPSVSVTLSIIGQIEDKNYWADCQKIIATFPKNIKVHYIGAIPNAVIDVHIQSHHFCVLPTFGENFGHAIFESFINGRPVIVSDQTPWRHLENTGIGWDLPLNNRSYWAEKLNLASQMNQNEFNLYCEGSRAFAQNYVYNSDIKYKYKSLFSS